MPRSTVKIFQCKYMFHF